MFLYVYRIVCDPAELISPRLRSLKALISFRREIELRTLLHFDSNTIRNNVFHSDLKHLTTYHLHKETINKLRMIIYK